MCGSLQLSATERLIVKAGDMVRCNLVYPPLKRDIPFSEHRFMRAEKLNWWTDKLSTQYPNLGQNVLHQLTIPCVGFQEQDIHIPIPKHCGVRAYVHPDLYSNRWVISILTIPVDRYYDNKLVERVRQNVIDIHHRMPLVVQVA